MEKEFSLKTLWATVSSRSSCSRRVVPCTLNVEINAVDDTCNASLEFSGCPVNLAEDALWMFTAHTCACCGVRERELLCSHCRFDDAKSNFFSKYPVMKAVETGADVRHIGRIEVMFQNGDVFSLGLACSSTEETQQFTAVCNSLSSVGRLVECKTTGCNTRRSNTRRSTVDSHIDVTEEGAKEADRHMQELLMAEDQSIPSHVPSSARRKQKKSKKRFGFPRRCAVAEDEFSTPCAEIDQDSSAHASHHDSGTDVDVTDEVAKEADSHMQDDMTDEGAKEADRHMQELLMAERQMAQSPASSSAKRKLKKKQKRLEFQVSSVEAQHHDSLAPCVDILHDDLAVGSHGRACDDSGTGSMSAEDTNLVPYPEDNLGGVYSVGSYESWMTVSRRKRVPKEAEDENVEPGGDAATSCGDTACTIETAVGSMCSATVEPAQEETLGRLVVCRRLDDENSRCLDEAAVALAYSANLEHEQQEEAVMNIVVDQRLEEERAWCSIEAAAGLAYSVRLEPQPQEETIMKPVVDQQAEEERALCSIEAAVGLAYSADLEPEPQKNVMISYAADYREEDEQAWSSIQAAIGLAFAAHLGPEPHEQTTMSLAAEQRGEEERALWACNVNPTQAALDLSAEMKHDVKAKLEQGVLGADIVSDYGPRWRNAVREFIEADLQPASLRYHQDEATATRNVVEASLSNSCAMGTQTDSAPNGVLLDKVFDAVEGEYAVDQSVPAMEPMKIVPILPRACCMLPTSDAPAMIQIERWRISCRIVCTTLDDSASSCGAACRDEACFCSNVSEASTVCCQDDDCWMSSQMDNLWSYHDCTYSASNWM